MFHRFKQNSRILVLAMLAIGLMFFVVACGGNQLAYKVSGAASQAEVTYINSEGASQTETVTLPWETSFQVGSSAEFSLIANNTSEQSGISCAVLLNEKELGRADANYYASCEGNFKKSGGSLTTGFHSSKDVLPGGVAAGPKATATLAPPTATPAPTPTSTPTVGERVEQGMAYYEQGELDKALAEYKEAIALEPDNPRIYRNTGTVYADQLKWEEAAAAYEKAISLDPNFGEAYGDMVGAYVRLDKLSEAIEAGEKGIELAPDYAMGHNNLGAAYNKQGQTDKAVAEYQEAIRLDPDFALPHYNWGLIKYKQNQVDQAIAEWQEAARLAPNYPSTHKNLGIVYFEREQVADALAEFETYLQLAPDAPDRAQVEEDIAKLKAQIDAEAESDVKTYKNEYMGLTLAYPASWVLKDSISDEASIVVLGTNQDFATKTTPSVYAKPGASVQIYITDLSQYPSATTLVDLQDEILKKFYPPVVPAGKISPISIPGKLGGGIEGIEGYYTPELDEGPPLQFGITTVTQGGRVMVMVGIWGKEYASQVESDIHTVFSSVDLQLTAPEILMNAIFLSAQQEDYAVLNQLCHPDAGNDSDTQAICDIETATLASQAKFAKYFKKGKLTGRARFSKDGTRAEVPFLVGPDGDQEETMKFILYNDEWYLYSF